MEPRRARPFATTRRETAPLRHRQRRDGVPYSRLMACIESTRAPGPADFVDKSTSDITTRQPYGRWAEGLPFAPRYPCRRFEGLFQDAMATNSTADVPPEAG